MEDFAQQEAFLQRADSPVREEHTTIFRQGMGKPATQLTNRGGQFEQSKSGVVRLSSELLQSEDYDSEEQESQLFSGYDVLEQEERVDSAADHKFLVCVDPESLITYLLNLKSQGKLSNEIVIESETIDQGRVESGQLQRYKERILEAKTVMEELLEIPHFKWDYGQATEADKYRRRKFQKYLLQKEASEYPCYAYQSQLSKAFDKNPSIEIIVHLNEYDDLLENSKPIETSQSLVTSAEEVLKYLKRKIQNRDNRAEFMPRGGEKNEFVLKAFGYREYLVGGYPLLSYDRVRKALRKKQKLKLSLTERPDVEASFPILVKTHPKIRVLKSVSPLFWYPPEIALDIQLARIKKKQFNMQEKYRVNSEEERPEMLLFRHQQILNQSPLDNTLARVDVFIYSAEVNWRFRVKIVGLEHLNLVFRELESASKPCAFRVATHNGATLPRNVTNMVEKKEHKASKKEASKQIKDANKWKEDILFDAKKNVDPAPVNREIARGLSFAYDFPFINFANHYEHLRRPMENFNLVVKGHKKDSAKEFFVPHQLAVDVMLLHGCELLAKSHTKRIPFTYAPRFNQWLALTIQEALQKGLRFESWDIRYCQLPKKSRLGFNVKAISAKGEERVIASATFLIFDQEGRFQEGKHPIRLWPFYRVDERLGCMKEYRGYESFGRRWPPRHHPELFIELESFSEKMKWQARDELLIEKCALSKNEVDKEDSELLAEIADGETIAEMRNLIETDPIGELSACDKRKLFVCREHYMKIPWALPIFLRSVDWLHPLQVGEVLKLLRGWQRMTDEQAIALLDAKFADEQVRLYALELISKMSDDNLALYMLQFSQTLLYEDYHFSALGEMLLERALHNPYVVGHAFFWALKANLHMRTSYERYSLLLEQFLMLCGNFKRELKIQFEVNNNLVTVSQCVQQYGRVLKKRRKEAKKRGLPHPPSVNTMGAQKLMEVREKLPALFTISIEPKILIRDFDYPGLVVFDSKKKPLRLVGINEQLGGQEIKVIFKCGDDLRQDILTLQIIELMDKIWLEEGQDLSMTPYRVLGTGDQKGYLEFVGNSKTIAAMQKARFAAFDDTSIHRYIHERLYHKYNCNEEKVKEQMDIMRDNFLRSTAGYCVATYILGIGDRHPDNIMINVDTGVLLHIDFGHILGDKKKKFGIEREKDPFVLTKEMAFFINEGKRVFSKKHHKRNQVVNADEEDDGEPAWKTPSFKRFEEECVRAYNHLRKNGARFINLLLIMLSAGIPQLKHESNIQYVKNALKLDMTEYEAKVDFKKQITKAMKTFSRRFDNFIHNWKHS